MAGLFKSFFQAGFECSTHRMRGGREDVIAASEHDRTAETDYRSLQPFGVRTVRDGVRWHLVETSPGCYDWSSFLPMLRAAHRTGTEVIWDLCHYGWPDDLDIFSAAFVERFSRFAGAVAHLVRQETDAMGFYCPVNEISFWAWAGGTVGFMNPFRRGQGDALKHQLVRATLAAIEAIWAVDPGARIVHIDPLINVTVSPRARPERKAAAEEQRLAQYHAWDLLAGRRHPELGGAPRYLDVLGVNYYWDNQRLLKGQTLDIGHPLYRPFRSMLGEVYARYRRPLFIAETGIEGNRRPAWLAYVAEEARAAMREGVPLEGFCWYPILDHPGWGDQRYCPNGLFGYADASGARPVYEPLAHAWQQEHALFAPLIGEEG